MLLTGFSVHAAACAGSPEQACQISLESQLPSGTPYRLKVAESLINDPGLSQNQFSGYWGAGGAIPVSRAVSIAFSVDGLRFHMPDKSFSDLGNLTAVEVKENQHAIVLVVNGGQSEQAYYATFVFIDGVLRKRTVRNKTAPGTVWEKTTYRQPNP